MVAVLRFRLLFLFFLSLIAIPLYAQEPDTEARVDLLLREGIALHDNGEYEKAIEKYLQALELDPNNASGLYELGFSYFEIGQYQKSLKAAEQGVTLNSELQGRFYLLMANCHDVLKEPQKAVDTYLKAIKLLPNDGMVRFNLALTYAGMGKTAEAKETIKEGLLLNPNHPSSHYLLGTIYEAEQERIPALMAFVRFLVLEPNTKRSADILDKMARMMRSGVRKNSGEKEGLEVRLNPASINSQEGDFTVIDLAVGMLNVAGVIDSVEKSEFEEMHYLLTSIFQTMAEVSPSQKGERSGFASAYYASYFEELAGKDYTEALAHWVCISMEDPAIEEWFQQEEHEETTKAFLEWSQGFEWKGE